MSGPILVTGGAGFVGCHLCERLLDEGNEVICLDNFYTGHWRNIKEAMAHPRFSVIDRDVRDPGELGAVSRIYNLACPASPVHYQRDRIMTTLTTVIGAHRMLDLAVQSGARVLFASTSEVYGDPLITPQAESYWGNVNPNGVRSCYDEGKRLAESLAVSYHEESGADIRIARIFNTYGPRMDINDGRVVSNFIVEALTNRPLTVFGDGSQTRSFCFVSDMVEALIRLMESPAYTGPTNLGNPTERSIAEFARIIKEMTGTASPIVFEELPPDDPKIRRPDITKAKAELNWAPSVTLEEGLEKTIAYFRTII